MEEKDENRCHYWSRRKHWVAPTEESRRKIRVTPYLAGAHSWRGGYRCQYCGKYASTDSCFPGVQSVVHLAASPAVDSPWEAVLHNNIIGTYHVFEAARQAGVKQIIFASSNHAVGTYEQEFEPGPNRPHDKVIDQLVPIRPDSLYGVSKVFGEALSRYYADHLGMHVISLRIGWITPTNIPEGNNLAEPGVTMWQSHEDFVQMVEKCLEAEEIQFDIFYGISDNPFHFFDLEHARQEIGYEPQDTSLEKMHETKNTREGSALEEGDERPGASVGR